MKKVALIFALLFAITLFSGQNCRVMAQSTRQPTIRGEWRVISTNCLDVIAEKGGLTRVFIFKPPTGYNPGPAGDLGVLAKCQKVQAGWIIVVESEAEYSFFPPVSPAAAKSKSAAPSPPLPPSPPTGLRRVN